MTLVFDKGTPMNTIFPFIYRAAKHVRSGVLLLLLLGSTASAGAVGIESTFDPGTGADGWEAIVCDNPGCPFSAETGSLVFPSALFGHDLADPQPFEPGAGHLFMVDPGSDDTGMYEAPSAFGDALSGPGAVLEIDIYVDSGLDGEYDTGDTLGLVPLFYIENVAASAGVIYGLPVAAMPLDTWLSFDIPLVPNGDPSAGPGLWAGFSGGGVGLDDPAGTALGIALGAAPGDTIFRIWGELTNDSADLDGTSLDNVRITVIPVPAALPMLLSAVAAFGFWRRPSS